MCFIKGTVAPVWVWLKVVWLERAKMGKELLSILKMFHSSLWLLKNGNRNAAFQRKGMEIATFLPIAAGKFSLLSYWLVAGIWAFPSGFPIPF
jgi:hypothetical protein